MGCMLFLWGCSDDQTYSLVGSTDKIALVRVVVDLRVLPDDHYRDVDGANGKLSLQESVFLGRYVSELQDIINEALTGSLTTAVEFQHNAVFQQLPAWPLDAFDRVLPPYKAIRIEDQIYAQMLCDGLGVDAVAGLRFRFHSAVEEKGVLAGILPGEVEEFFGLEVVLTVVSREGRVRRMTVLGEAASQYALPKNAVPEPYFFGLTGARRGFYLEAMEGVKRQLGRHSPST